MDIKRAFGFQWHITERCDQRCKHCYSVAEQEKKIVNKELDKYQCYSVIDKILNFCRNNNSMPGITLTGGDPLLCNHFWDIAEYLNKKGISFRILGNPFHLDTKACQSLYNLGCSSYQMSLDGLEATHDFIRKKGSFEATMDSFVLLRNAGIVTVAMNTVTSTNYSELIDLIHLVVDAKVDIFAFARYVPNSLSKSLEIIKPESYRNLLEDVWQTYIKLENKGTTFSLKDHLFKLLLWEKGLFQPSNNKVVIDGCSCGIRAIAILPDGQVYACRRFLSPVGNVTLSTIDDIFFGETMANYRNIEGLSGCNECELLYDCRGCHAVSKGVYGDYFAKDPQCWKL